MTVFLFDILLRALTNACVVLLCVFDKRKICWGKSKIEKVRTGLFHFCGLAFYIYVKMHVALWPIYRLSVGALNLNIVTIYFFLQMRTRTHNAHARQRIVDRTKQVLQSATVITTFVLTNLFYFIFFLLSYLSCSLLFLFFLFCFIHCRSLFLILIGRLHDRGALLNDNLLMDWYPGGKLIGSHRTKCCQVHCNRTTMFGIDWPA